MTAGVWRSAKAEMVVDENVMVSMRDGVQLEADVFRPAAPGRYPVLVTRSPYGRKAMPRLIATREALGSYWVSKGYVYVDQDCRGRFGSEGSYEYLVSDRDDGYDTIEWAAGQGWSNGRVGTYGQSFMAMTQYALAPTNPPHLVAMCPVSAPANSHGGSAYGRQGGFHLGWRIPFALFLGVETARRAGRADEWAAEMSQHLGSVETVIPRLSPEAEMHLPLEDWATRLAEVAPWLGEQLAHPEDGEYWRRTSLRGRERQVDVPVFHIGSWYDPFVEGALESFGALDADGGPRARGNQKLLIGPWSHLEPFVDPTTGGAGELDFGAEAAIELIEEERRWYDHWLKGEPNGIMDEAPVRIFVMGRNQWRDEHEWPLARTRYTAAYLRSGGRAADDLDDGRISFDAPAAEPADTFVYDPDDPVPTRGGSTLGMFPGGFDQREIEGRPDVLVYSTAVLDTDLEVTGPVQLVLHASTTAVDTDFTARLVDVRPDGYAQNVCDGLLRARYRESLSEPSSLVPGQPYRFEIQLQPTSHVFLAGHRLRVEVSSSNFPWFDRNPNTGEPLTTARSTIAARQTVYHDTTRPSHLVLPVIP